MNNEKNIEIKDNEKSLETKVKDFALEVVKCALIEVIISGRTLDTLFRLIEWLG